MNIPMSWIKEYTDIPCNEKTYIEKITLSGSKVEALTYPGHNIALVVVGKILSVDPHPNAEKLVMTQTDVGNGEILQIITGAKNIFPGAYVPVAKDGAVLASGTKIKTGKLRGETSQGMLCSIEELGYTSQDYPEAPENGVYIFQEPQTPGASVVDLLSLKDEVVEYEITSNRPDCFSVVGLAREAAATFHTPFRYPEIKVQEKGSGNIHEMIAIQNQNPALCPRYIARVVQDVRIEPSPLWLRHRLIASGIRPINNIVDITNYVMLELGQPMHAFDIDTVKNRTIIIRNAQEGENCTTLDGVKRILDPSALVIADSEKAIAIAGVMGGENSKVTEGASAILFESANFLGSNVRLTAKKLGLRTDASARYEKGLDPNLSIQAVNRAVQLVEQLGCGKTVPGVVDCYPKPLNSWEIPYSPEHINALLGTNLSNEEMEHYLSRLEILAADHIAKIPTFRPDLEQEADLAEEIARLYGYDRIPVTLTFGSPATGKKTAAQNFEDAIRNHMTALGFFEMMSYHFESPKTFDKLNLPENDPLRRCIRIVNPLGEDYSIMRTNTLNGMFLALSTNYNRRNPTASLFEYSKIYRSDTLPLKDLPEEKNTLTLGEYGHGDFFDFKGSVQSFFAYNHMTDIDYQPETSLPFMHPGRCAKILIQGHEVGFLGEAHPTVLKNYDIDARAYIAVLDVDALFPHVGKQPTYQPLPKFPGMQRDLSILVKDAVLAKEIERATRKKGGPYLESVEFFDIYKGKQIQAGYKSVSFRIHFRAPDRTLKEEEISETTKNILDHLEKTTGAQLRDR